MNATARWMKFVLIAVLAVGANFCTEQVFAADLPLATSSPMTGVAFDDRPLLLPVQRNFQMAMLTASSELGRSCGKMEAYGWRMSQTEQSRVNQIFNSTVDRMRMAGYAIAPQKIASVSNDITLFTADSHDKHFIFLWSAGELGLVMTLCQTTAPLPGSSRSASTLVPSVQTFPVPTDVVSAHLEAISRATDKVSNGPFTPIGDWVGGYTCAQGYTGGTLKITHITGKNFEGEFRFYPTEKNRTVPAGSYTVYGQYDEDSKRILINPGKWLQRPKNYYNTVIVGSFDAAHDTFSAYFQGISGCTSFEGKHMSQPAVSVATKKHKTTKPVVKKKKPVKKPVVPKTTTIISPAPAPLAPVVPVAPATAIPAGTSSVELPMPLTPEAPPATAPSTVSVIPPNAPPPSTVAPTVPAAPPPLPADDKAPAPGITLSAPTKN